MKVFIDTSAFCALTVPKDQFNSAAKIIHKQIQDKKAHIYSSDYVLDEVYTLLKTRGSHAVSVRFMDEIQKNNIIILRITEDIEEAAKTIFRQLASQVAGDKPPRYGQLPSLQIIYKRTRIRILSPFRNQSLPHGII